MSGSRTRLTSSTRRVSASSSFVGGYSRPSGDCSASSPSVSSYWRSTRLSLPLCLGLPVSSASHVRSLLEALVAGDGVTGENVSGFTVSIDDIEVMDVERGRGGERCRLRRKSTRCGCHSGKNASFSDAIGYIGISSMSQKKKKRYMDPQMSVEIVYTDYRMLLHVIERMQQSHNDLRQLSVQNRPPSAFLLGGIIKLSSNSELPSSAR